MNKNPLFNHGNVVWAWNKRTTGLPMKVLISGAYTLNNPCILWFKSAYPEDANFTYTLQDHCGRLPVGSLLFKTEEDCAIAILAALREENARTLKRITRLVNHVEIPFLN